MKSLLLIRHAEAANPKGIDDFDRPLTPFGQEQVEILGQELNHKQLSPDIWLSSPALRAKTTAQALWGVMQTQLPIRFEPAIYEASEQTLFQLINDLLDGYTFAALTGHNPGLSYLLYNLCSEVREVPPCTALLIDFEVDHWSHISSGSGTLRWYYTPVG